MSEQSTLQSFGAELKRAREAHSRSLDEISSQTKIHRRHLEAIEAGELAQLPQGPYVKAFLREYARAVGLKVPETFAQPAAPANRDPRVVSRPAQAAQAMLDSDVLPIATVAKETARFANEAVTTAVKTVAKTTESVVKLVETGSKDALELITSRSLWEEADEVRRERHGLPPLPKKIEQKPTPKLGDKTSAPRSAVNQPIGEAVMANSPETLPAPVDARQSTETYAPPAAPVRKASSKGATNVVIALLIILFGGAAWYALRSNKQEVGGQSAVKNYVPAPLDKPQPVATPRPLPPVVNPAPAETSVAPGDSLRFSLSAKEPVWVSIASDGIAAYKGEMKAGEVRSFKARDKFIVNLGNQKSVAMTFDGQALSGLPTIKNSGIVVRNLVLTRDHASLAGQNISLVQPPPAVSSVPAASVPASQTTQQSAATTTKPAATSHSNSLKPRSSASTKPNATTKPGATKPGTSKNPRKPSTTPVKRPPVKSGTITPLDPVPARPQ